MNLLTLFSQEQLNHLFNPRPGETKIGQQLSVLSHFDNNALAKAKNNGKHYALLGISEELGPRANLGLGGANQSFIPAMQAFANLQSNRFFSGSECILIGYICPKNEHIDQPVDVLRTSVAELDNSVTQVIEMLLAADIEPIVIGGGHNNAFGLLKASSSHHKQKMAAVNLDPHCDFRLLEGRHSGNGFSYAANEGYLGQYHILGLHEQKNSEASLQQLDQFGASWHSFQDIWIRGHISLTQALTDIIHSNQTTPLGLEIDLDAISELPSSAMTFAGVPLTDACRYVATLAAQCPCTYLHLAEAAPARHPAGIDAGNRVTGQAIAELLLAYLTNRP